MHELSLVAELVDECRRQAQGRPVSAVRVRWCSPALDDEIRQAFSMLTSATALDGAVLEVEVRPLVVDCPCGFAGPAAADDVVGYLFICPKCARVGSTGSPELELLEVRLSGRD